MLNRVYCKPTMIKEYIDHYASRQVSWERFRNVLLLDFGPVFLKIHGESIRKIFHFKKEVREQQSNRYINL